MATAGETPRTTARGHRTREQLLDAARRLFAERGVDGVSLREINRAAGQANVSALQYHFGDRAGLLRAVLEPHHRRVDALRHALLDACEADGTADLRSLGEALVRPLAALLEEPGGGREVLRILAQLLGRPDTAEFAQAFAGPGSFERWRRLVARRMAPEAVRLHRRFTAFRITCVELARRAGERRRDDRLFTSHLVDLVTALLAAPVSGETRALLAERRSL